MSPGFARFYPRGRIARLVRVGTALLRSWGEIEIVDRVFAHSVVLQAKGAPQKTPALHGMTRLQ
jgi:hypothetical protein